MLFMEPGLLGPGPGGSVRIFTFCTKETERVHSGVRRSDKHDVSRHGAEHWVNIEGADSCPALAASPLASLTALVGASPILLSQNYVSLCQDEWSIPTISVRDKFQPSL